MSLIHMSPQLLAALQELSSLVASEGDLDRTLKTVVDLSVGTLPGCDSAGVTLKDSDGRKFTVSATDDFALKIDAIQYDTDQGPCLQAIEDGETIVVEAISDEVRWPEFRGRAEQAGVGSTLSLPLSIDGGEGALNLYSRSERAFDEETRLLGDIYAKQAEIAMKNAVMYAAARQLAAQLEEAVESRDLIGQAKGILMERESMTDEEAFQMLVSASQAANIKVREIAKRIVAEKNPNAGGDNSTV